MSISTNDIFVFLYRHCGSALLQSKNKLRWPLGFNFYTLVIFLWLIPQPHLARCIMLKYTFQPYDLDAISNPQELTGDAMAFFWLRLAYFFRRIDPQTGMSTSLVRLQMDPQSLDDIAICTRFFKENSVERGPHLYLNPAGATFEGALSTFNWIRSFWRAFVEHALGPQEIEHVQAVNAFLDKMEKTK